MKQYTILPGQANFRPLEPWMPRRASGFSLSCRLHPSCWWSVEDWEGDRDRNDWNKLKGETWALSRNNRCSAMIAWRPGTAENTFEVTAYTNDRRGGWEVTGEPVLVFAGEVFLATCTMYDDAVQYEISYFGNTTEYIHAWRRPWLGWFREVGTSIGGANNSTGPYGGKATQEMTMEIDYKVIR